MAPVRATDRYSIQDGEWSSAFPVAPTFIDDAFIYNNLTISTGVANGQNVYLHGSLSITSPGSLVLYSNHTYGYLTAFAGASLTLDSASTTLNHLILSGGTVTLRGSSALNIVYEVQGNSGTLAVQGGTLNVGGDLTLMSGSTLSLQVNSAADHGSVHVAGNMTVDPGATLDLSGAGNLRPGDKLSLLTVDGTTSGSFGTVTNNFQNALGFQLSADPDTGALVITAVENSFAPFATNGNQTSLARILDQVAGDARMTPLIGDLNALPGASLPAAFNAIAPLQQTMVAQTTLNVARQAFGTLQNRMDNIRAGSTGLSLSQFNWLDQSIPGSALLADTGLPTGVKAFRPAPDNRWGFFAAADGGFGDIDGATTQSNYHGAGFTAGADYRPDPSLAVGFALGYDYAKIDFDHSGSHSTADSVRFGPYAAWKDRGGDWVEGTAGGAVHFYDSARDTLGGTARSGSAGLEFDGSAKYGHDFKVKQWTLTPTLGFDYLHLGIGKYTETGSDAPLTVAAQDADSLRSNLGGTAAYGFTWKEIAWTPYVQAGWAHEFLDASQAVDARFASGAGGTFTTTGDRIGRDSATFGAGLSAGLSKDLTAVLSYAGEANSTYQDHAFNAAVRVAF